MESRKTPGMECPRCRHFIPTTITELLNANGLECPHCHLRLIINRHESQRAMEILHQVDDAQQNLNRASKFNR